MVLTGGYEPRHEVMEAIQGSGMFAVFVEDDTYTVASEIHDLLVKTHGADTGKIALIKSLVEQSLDLDRFLEVAVPA